MQVRHVAVYLKDIMKDENVKRAVPYTTKSGLQIGCAYTPPPQQLTREGEQVQAALLGYRSAAFERSSLMAYITVVLLVITFLMLVIK